MFILFFAVWMLLNGRVTWETAGFGLAVAALLYWFCCRYMHYSPKRDRDIFRKTGKFLRILALLTVEIFKANFAVLPYIYGRGKKPEPVVAHFSMPRLKSETGRVILANCITMTPGTITGSLKGEEYLVHCLDRSFARGLDTSAFVDAVAAWEER